MQNRVTTRDGLELPIEKRKVELKWTEKNVMQRLERRDRNNIRIEKIRVRDNKERRGFNKQTKNL